MGIKHLWTVLTPFCERKPLYELKGKTVAIDLSCWICEAQNITEFQVQPRMYLRNLYFRTCYLLLMDVNPVYVLEGKAPELKYDTIASRNAVQFKGAKPKTDSVKPNKDRTRFHCTLKQCEEMLRSMGLACIKGNGEAESLCAYLNDKGLVAGCISQDSDCFAYGAKIVFRNFSVSTQGPYAAGGGAVDIYDITKPQQSIGFGRNKIIAMALLCGSDYNKGVQGVGKESVMKFFERVPEDEVLERIRSWRSKTAYFERLERQMCDKSVCTSCGHQGKLTMHNKNGCASCETRKGCDISKFKEERQYDKNELGLRSKALQDPDFPDEHLINEFLVPKDSVSKLSLRWKQPNLVGFVKFAMKFLQWEPIYSFQKMLPIVTRWYLTNGYRESNDGSESRKLLRPDRIKKTRVLKGIPSYEIIWTDPFDDLKDLFRDLPVDRDQLLSTIEPQILVDNAHPELAEIFKLSKIKPKPVSKRRKKAAEAGDTNGEKKPRKRAIKSKKIEEKDQMEDLENGLVSLEIRKPEKIVGPLDEFLKRNVLRGRNVGRCQTSTPVRGTRDDTFGDTSLMDNDDDFDYSDVVDEIISRKPDYIQNLPQMQTVECDVENYDLNTSSFFVSNLVDNDVFEQNFTVNDESDDDSDEKN